MNYYENIVILSDSLNEEAYESSEKKIIETIEKAEGEVLKHEKWGRRKLTYEINKHKNGIYIFFVFRSPATAIKKLENFYKLFDPLVKYMVIKLEKKEIAALHESMQSEKTEKKVSEDIENKVNNQRGES